MSTDAVPAHWLRANHMTRLPRRHVVLDTEAVERDTGNARVQTFRLACASFDHQTKAGRAWRPTERERFTDPCALWRWVTERCRPGQRLVVVAHNLAYDLRIANAFGIMPALGWRLDMVRLDGGAAWCQWRRDDLSVTMVDTVSWFGCGLDRIAGLLHLTKPKLPTSSAPADEWWSRCEADVEVLRQAWRLVLDWIEREDLGNWKPTGAGQGWAYFRHRHMTHKVLHHGLPALAQIERTAAWTGRCEAWRWGRLPAGPWSEWDFAAAYARVAEDAEVPTRLQGHLGPRTAQRALDGLDGSEAVLRCRIATETPTVPSRGCHGVVWPTGRFESWLWGCEARMARDAGATVETVEGWRYETAPALRQWAGWVLDRLDDGPDQLHPALRLIVKGWSRTTVGRFGAQWSTWDDIGESHGLDSSLRHAENGDTGRRYRMMMVGGRCLSEGERSDAPDGAVHVMSWIMAACRVRLWRAMTEAGFENIAYVDTDGLLVNDVGSRHLEAAGLPGLRMKSKWRSGEVLGPRQLVLSGQLRAAGIPLSAVRVGPRSWEAEIWRSLPASLRRGELDSVTVADRRFVLRGTDHRRAHGPAGITAPIRVESW